MSLASKIYSIKCKLYTFLVIPHILAFVLTGRGKSFKYDLLCMFGKCDIKTFISILYGKNTCEIYFITEWDTHSLRYFLFYVHQTKLFI